jgi:hypothetical protein
MTDARALLRWIATSVLGGVVVGGGIFVLTSQHEEYAYLGPLCRGAEVRAAGFDPWTGDPIGAIYVCNQVFPESPPAHPVTEPPPQDLMGRHAIPVQSGFALGFVGTAVLLWLRRGRATLRVGD